MTYRGYTLSRMKDGRLMIEGRDRDVVMILDDCYLSEAVDKIDILVEDEKGGLNDESDS